VASGAVDLHSAEGLALIGHELAHVLQQRAGRVPGGGVNEDPALEAEADQAGRRAARGEPAGPAVADGAPVDGPVAGAPSTQVGQPGGKDLLRRLLGRTPPTPPAAPAPAPAPAAPGSLNAAAIEAQLATMQRRMDALAAELRRPGLRDARPIAAKMKELERTMHALVDASISALPPGPDLLESESESESESGSESEAEGEAPIRAYAPLTPRGQETPYQPIPVESSEPHIYAMSPSEDPTAGTYAATPVSFAALPARSAESGGEGHYSTLPSFPEEAPAPATGVTPTAMDRVLSTLPPAVHGVVRSALESVTPAVLRAQGLDPATATATYGRFVIALHAIARRGSDTAQVQAEVDALVRKYAG
jgi:hypothetical protein